MLADFKIRKDKWLLVLAFILMPIVIYIYFLRIKTNVIYGDDLSIYINNMSLKSFSKKINLSLSAQKYRPVHDFVMHYMIVLFQKHLTYYYLFNVAVQTLNAFLFALIANVFLRSAYLSFFFGLLVGISRFAYFNISQLYNGGVLEGLAMSFFFLSLYCLLKVLVHPNLQKQKLLIWSIFFANLSIYTHERYIVLILFIIGVIAFSTGLKTLNKSQKVFLYLLAVLSIVLNVVIKKYVFFIPFFVGTGGTNISFSFLAAFNYFIQGVASIFEINSGPDYLVGIPFSNLSFVYKVLVLLLACCFLYILVTYLVKIIKIKPLKKSNNATAFISLIFLFGLCLAPAIVTIRLEQRWLQASFSIFVLLNVIAVSHIDFRTSYRKSILLYLFVFLFLSVDAMYFYLGNKNIYMSNALAAAVNFKAAIDNDIIHSNSSTLFVWQNVKDINNENTINWELVGGDFFKYYQNKNKRIIFVDSVYEKLHAGIASEISNFNLKTDQIIFLGNGIVDITSDFLKDSLKNVNIEKLNIISAKNKVHYNLKFLEINNKYIDDKFLIRGFYENENGLRWTNGNVVIGFIGNYVVNDSLSIKINTYMPPICKNVYPKLTLKDEIGKIYQPIFSTRTGDIFIYKFHFKQSTNIQEMDILSDTIDASPDKRTLSFPFISLEISH